MKQWVSWIRRAALGVAALIGVGTLYTAAAADTVRLAIVNTPKFSGLIDSLIKDFKASGGGQFEIEVYGGSDVFERAREGKADLVIAHFGKVDFDQFVLDGLGSWPKMVFANQIAIIGPASDPAGIRGLSSAAEALKRIAAAEAPFVVNRLPGISSATDVLWRQVGITPSGAWFLDPGVGKGQAMKLAQEKQAYTVWGAPPFLRFKEKHAATLELLVTADPYLQRVMAATVVNPAKIAGVNKDRAEALVAYLTSARAQALIAAFRQTGYDGQLWWPSARHNANEGHDE